MNERAILDKLFAAGEEMNIPKKTVTIERVGLSFTLQGLKDSAIEKLERQYTVKGELERKRYNRAVVAAATVAINDNPKVTWSHPEIISHYKASGPEAAIKAAFLAGEITQLADVVLELSGYYDTAKEVEQAKNSLEKED